MTIIRAPFCQVSLDRKPLWVLLPSSVAQHFLRGQRIGTQKCQTSHLTPPSGQQNDGSRMTLSTHRCHYAINFTQSKIWPIFPLLVRASLVESAIRVQQFPNAVCFGNIISIDFWATREGRNSGEQNWHFASVRTNQRHKENVHCLF